MEDFCVWNRIGALTRSDSPQTESRRPHFWVFVVELWPFWDSYLVDPDIDWTGEHTSTVHNPPWYTTESSQLPSLISYCILHISIPTFRLIFTPRFYPVVDSRSHFDQWACPCTGFPIALGCLMIICSQARNFDFSICNPFVPCHHLFICWHAKCASLNREGSEELLTLINWSSAQTKFLQRSSNRRWVPTKMDHFMTS